MNTDIAVIGGGASGLSAAIEAKKSCPSAEVSILEKLPRCGKKIIATGNGKCNLSNISLSPRNYHGSVNAMEIINNAPGYYEFFTENLGVLCVTGSEGREGGIYPSSNSSSTVLNALRLKIQEMNISEVCGFDVNSLRQTENGFVVSSADDEIYCRKLIIAAGGCAGTSFGTDGSMLRILKNMGYKISDICPAVAPLKVNPMQLKGLKGVRAKGSISALSGGKILRTEKGEIQFNENTISGVCVFNLAYLFRDYENLVLRADIMPHMDENQLADYLFSIRKKRAGYPIEEMITGAFVKNLSVYLVKNILGKPLSDKIKSLSDNDIKLLAGGIKNLGFNVTGCSSWQNAQSTYGGIHADCIDNNLESKLHRGVYFCGEILDTVGDCGGFNLQFAWSSGITAGRNCGKSLNNA
ncbi:MAG: aminoacetone oxidase family FAD-binding enzyme [Ruminococcus sp.]|nr:aminoacetone oxidase family FAD-binding enzyme [Ruminococcus sp.]